MTIGRAGENLVKFACPITFTSRAPGRTGTGAVMGSKNLKSIVVRGTGKVAVKDPDGLKKLTQWGAKNVRVNVAMAGLQKYGTAETVLAQQSVGGLPTHNWDSGVFDQAEEISGERMYDTILLKNDTCYACAVRCKRVVEVKELWGRGPLRRSGVREPGDARLLLHGLRPGPGGAGQPDLQPGGDGPDRGRRDDRLGDGCLCQGRDHAGRHRRHADRVGRCRDDGQADGDDRHPRGVRRRAGRGDERRLPTSSAARARELITAVKGNALPAHMPQVKRSLALIYAVNPFGADHQSSEHDPGYAPDSDEESLRRLALLGLTDPRTR